MTTYEALKVIVSELDMNVQVEIVSTNVVKSCNTMYLKVDNVVSDSSGATFTISSIEVNGEITLVPDTTDFVGSVLIPSVKAPTYLSGKPKSANSEYLQMDAQSMNKLPLIWYLTDAQTQGGGEDSSVTTASNVRLFFLDETDEPKWVTDEHYTIVISRMHNLVKRFKETIKANYRISYTSSITLDHERFGVYLRNGADEKVIDEDLSGVELKLDLKIINC